MKYCFSLLLIVCSLFSMAQTIEVQGPQSGVWDADTVRVTGDVTVVDTLTVAPGTMVLFDGFYGIEIAHGASFIAQGTGDDSIVFTVADTLGFSVYNQGKGGWNGFQLYKAGQVRMSYCLVQYGKAADTLDQRGGAMNVRYSEDMEFDHCRFFCNFAREHGGAINAENSVMRFSHCAINDNKVYTDDNLYYMYGGGARFLKCEIVMTDMEFRNNYGEITIGGALSMDSCAVLLDRAVFAYNRGLNGAGLYLLRSNDMKCRLSNLLIHDNISQHFGGGMAIADSSPEVYNVTVVGNTSIGVDCNGIFYYQYSSPVLTNCIVCGNYPGEWGVVGDTIQQWIWTYEDYGPEFRNCLFEEGKGQFTNPEYIKVYEDILELDPGFVDPEHRDFHLREDSPCRDVGYLLTPDFILESVDLDGMPRLANQRVDIGPYEYSPAHVDEIAPVGKEVRLLGNPLNSQSRLCISLDVDSKVSVRFISALGRTVAEKTWGWQSQGTASLAIGDLVDSLAPGIYLLEICINDRTYTLKTIR